jgi:hypothetical protein
VRHNPAKAAVPEEGRKQFFFEKKNQKTFTLSFGPLTEQKFFGSFFQKRTTSFAFRLLPIGAPTGADNERNESLCHVGVTMKAGREKAVAYGAFKCADFGKRLGVALGWHLIDPPSRTGYHCAPHTANLPRDRIGIHLVVLSADSPNARAGSVGIGPPVSEALAGG